MNRRRLNRDHRKSSNQVGLGFRAVVPKDDQRWKITLKKRQNNMEFGYLHIEVHRYHVTHVDACLISSIIPVYSRVFILQSLNPAKDSGTYITRSRYFGFAMRFPGDLVVSKARLL